jgi:hypothetical protein
MITALVFFVEQIATGVYILLAVALFLALRALLRAQDSYRGTHFELERDIARFQRRNAATAFVLLAELALIVVGLQRVVAPTLRETLDNPMAIAQVVDDGEFLTPQPSPPSGGLVIDPSGVQFGEIDPAAQVLPTPTLTPTPVGTIVPNSPPAVCPSEDVQLQIPANGMIVFEPITVIGVARTENFSFYRFELKGQSTSGNFAYIGVDGTQPLTEMGPLGQFVPAFYEPGEYQFRVSVFDITSALRASCTVTIHISEPIPTATPLGTESGSS